MRSYFSLSKEKRVTIVRSEAEGERVRNHNPPVCRPLARAMDVQQLHTLPDISRWIATGRFVVFEEKNYKETRKIPKSAATPRACA